MSVKTLISILQDRDAFLREISDSIGLKRKLIDLNAIAAVSFGLYGAIIGSQHSLKQAISSCVKLPLLFLITAGICVPTLFIFSSLFGAKRSLLQTIVLLSTGVAIIGLALVGFAPVTVFFIVTTRSYQFFKVLNVFFFAVSGLLGLLIFSRIYVQAADNGLPALRPRRLFLRFWLLLFAFVGTQLAWTLRPFFGAPGLPFEIVREVGGNFYTDTFRSLRHLLGERESGRPRR
ncbi:MAG TPA: actin-binding WH2 domain-containing protein [Blastocatellia bacterium]|nr:actin-binding WH2 domain-containing protein [Blastocatellia bacterium]